MNKEIKYGFIAALLVGIGMAAGFTLKDGIPRQRKKEVKAGLDKLEEAVWYIEQNYVEQPNTTTLIDDAIKGILEGLDPHSVYIPPIEKKAIEEQMQGSFEGIGVEFNILEDTIYVVSPISGGPSETVGVMAGDAIIAIEKENVAGVKITNADVIKKLKGPKGTKVHVTVYRRSNRQKYDFEIIRDKIPLKSVDFAYKINANTGYIKVNRFAENTHNEFREALYNLKDQEIENLILDLRGNPGGYLEMAQRIADEFLTEGRRIVYTRGRTGDSQADYYATGNIAGFEKGALVILIDYGSASASEIVAGAVQDWDRGLVVGVRSFGKGLVQVQKDFSDGSAMRVVTSRYYTPSGRCIQKPYNKSSDEYGQEIFERFESGEIYDSSKVRLPDSLKFKTNSGRTVYGGGGIMPDIFVPRDTNGDTDYLRQLLSNGVFQQYAYLFADRHPGFEQQFSSGVSYNKKYQLGEKEWTDFIKLVGDNGITHDPVAFVRSKSLIESFVKANIGRVYFKDEGYFPAIHEQDNVIQKALTLIPLASELEKKGTFTRIK